MKKSFSRLLFLFPFFLLLNSCVDEPADELNKMIKIALRNDNTIDETEWNKLMGFSTERSEELYKIVNDENEIDDQKLTDLIITIANKRRNSDSPEIFKPETNKVNEVDKTVVNVFIENSGSMDGYVRGNTEFETALSGLLVDVDIVFNKKLNINFINTKIAPSQVKELEDFAGALDPSKKPYKDNFNKTSDLNKIFKLVLDSTSKDNISIFISDCIYSLGKDKDTGGALGRAQSLTKLAFYDKSREFDFSTIVLKMNSKFNGSYWDKNNDETKLNQQNRPYYIWIVGQDKKLQKLQKKIKLKELQGFENSYFLSNSQKNKDPKFTVLAGTNKKGNFKKSDRYAKEIKSIESIEYADGIFQFSIAIDLSKVVLVDKAYLTHIPNYTVSVGFTVESIDAIDRNNIEKRDLKMIDVKSFTHIITVSTSNKFTIQDLKLELLNRIPSWVDASNSNDDSDVKNELNKTFGLLYLVKGVSEAYKSQNPENISYSNINVTIKQ